MEQFIKRWEIYKTKFFAKMVYLLNRAHIINIRYHFPNLIEYAKTDGRVFKCGLYLPNPYLRRLESGSWDIESAMRQTGLSIGYPAWNLLYYSLLCSLIEKDASWVEQEAIIVETGTNLGFSTIIMAQALKDSCVQGCVHTVDIDQKNVESARRNVEKAGLSKYVKFYNEDSRLFLRRLAQDVKYLDFVMLDADHSEAAVLEEFQSVYEPVKRGQGKVYFDNTGSGGVARALKSIKQKYGGDIIEFPNCSWGPPGNAIWQPDQFWVFDKETPVIKELIETNWDAVQYGYSPKDRRMRILEEKNIYGMNTENIRFLINEISRRFAKNGVYLEVGTHQGSSLLSAALFNPGTRCIGIDNFSQFDDARLKLERNLELFNECKNIEFYNMDYKEAFKKIFSLEPALKVNVYFYDGYHSYRRQREGLDLILPYLADTCIIMVDDINWKQVDIANEAFLNENRGLKSVFKIKTKRNCSEDWWNGFEIIARGLE